MGTTSQKLTYLSETKSQLKDMINYGLDTGEKITSETTFRNYVKSLFDAFIKTMTYPDVLYNNLPKVTGEGTSVTLNDTVYAPMRVELSPSALEQVTTSGKNLFNKEATVSYIAHASYTYNNGVYTITPDGTGNINLNISCVISPGSYVFNSNTFLSNATILRDASNTSVYNFHSSYSNISFTTTIASTVLQFNWANPNNTTPFTLDLNSLMISTTGGEYEPFTYGASPNPQYPQEIHTVSGENEVNIINANLFDGILELGIINGNTGRNSANNNYVRCKNYIPVEELTNYKITIPEIPTAQILVYEYREDYSYNLPVNKGIAQNNYLTTNEGTKYIRVRPGAETTNTNLKIMINEGTTAIDYVPHQEQSLPLSLGDLEYCKIGDYEDGFIRTSGKNLFDKDDITLGKSISGTGEPVNSTGSVLSGFIAVNENTTYYLSHARGSNYVRTIGYYNDSKSFISAQSISGAENVSGSFTTPSNTRYVRVVSGSDYYTTCQLEKGSSATSYEPYDNGKWYLKKNIGKVVLNGSESWNVYTTTDSQGNTYGYYVPLSLRPLQETHTATFALSNHFIQNRIDAVTVIDTQGIYLGSGVSLFIKIAQSLISGGTLANFKTWLSEHNTTVYYVLATPAYTLLSDTLQTQLDNLAKAISYQDQTNVSQTNNDLPFVIKLSAIRDLSGIFEEI